MMAEMGKKVDFSIDQVKRAYRANFVSQSIVAMIAGPFLLANKEWTNEERPKKQAEFDHYMERARMAMEDGLERLEELPKEKLMD
ncbi:hypothetical protein L596_023374 [Steinernema carpocapsae]|nr:hypothetical protein L596_023374 [Steinernema carpocapsae]